MKNLKWLRKKKIHPVVFPKNSIKPPSFLLFPISRVTYLILYYQYLMLLGVRHLNLLHSSVTLNECILADIIPLQNDA